MQLERAVAAVGIAADWLAQVDLDTVDNTRLRNQLAAFKTAQSRLDGQLARLTHTADRTGAFIGTGARDTAEWLGIETGTSTRKNRTASQLGEAMSKSDELTDAVESGRISTDKATAAVSAAGDLPLDNDVIDEIVDLPLNAVRPTTESWRARTNAERDRDIAQTQRSRRYLTLTDQPDGMTRIEELLDPESAAAVRTTLDAVMNESAVDNTNRRRDQRCADALTQLAVAASKGKLTGGRSNAKLLATVPFETIVERAAARGITHAGPTLDADTIRKLACDAGIHRIITGPGSSILDFGHETRLVTDNLFLALVARDQHCRWPGCTIRATWCDAHHITEWTDGGPTSESNCALLCSYHHSVTHQPGWKLTGNGHHLTIHHPDGTTQTSTPPAIRFTETHTPTPTPAPVDEIHDPPPAEPLRADTNGRHEQPDPARPHEQLSLVS